MSPFDLIRARDGSMSLTKLAAACFHFALFVTVCFVSWKTQDFKLDMWTLYAATAVGHAVADKTGAQISAFKNKKLDTTTPPEA